MSQPVRSALTLVFGAPEADLFEVGVRRHVKGAQLELSAQTLDVQVEYRDLLVSGKATQLNRKLDSKKEHGQRGQMWEDKKKKDI